MVDGLNIVAGGREGSGEAQILGRSKDPLDVLAQFQQQNKQYLTQQRIEQQKGRLKKMDELKALLQFDYGQVWDADLENIQKEYDKMVDAATYYVNQGQDPTDPTTEAGKIVQSKKKQIETMAAQSKMDQAKVDAARAGFKPGEHDETYYAEQLEKLRTTPIDKRQNMATNLLVPAFDPYAGLDDIEIVVKESDIKKDGTKIRAYGPDEDAVRENAQAFHLANPDHYQNMKARGIVSTPEEHIDWLVDRRLKSKEGKTLFQKVVDEPKDGGGLQFNFGGGGSSAKLGKWSFGFNEMASPPVRDPNAAGDYPTVQGPLRIGVSYTDKQAPTIRIRPISTDGNTVPEVNMSIIEFQETPNPDEFIVRGVAISERDENVDNPIPSGTVVEALYSQNKQRVDAQIKGGDGTAFDLKEMVRQYKEAKTPKGQAKAAGVPETATIVDTELEGIEGIEMAVVKGDVTEVHVEGTVHSLDNDSQILKDIKSGARKPSSLKYLRKKVR